MNLQPLKVVYQLIVAELDGDGNIIGEHPQPPVTLYRPQFGELEQRVAASIDAGPAEPNRLETP